MSTSNNVVRENVGNQRVSRIYPIFLSSLCKELRSLRERIYLKVGEALSELGFGYLRQGHFLKGMQYCEEGVRLLSQVPTTGFLVRALRKLALAYLLTGRLRKAYNTWQEKQKVAYEHGAFDQI